MGIIQNAINQVLGTVTVGAKLMQKGTKPEVKKPNVENSSYEQKIKNTIAANQKAEQEFMNRQKQKENFNTTRDNILRGLNNGK